MRFLEQIQTGGKSLIYTSVANKLINAINAILRLEVSPQGAGSFEFAPGRSVLRLNLPALGAPQATHTFICFAAGGYVTTDIPSTTPVPLEE